MPRLPIVGVMGSGTESHEPESSQLGRWLAQEGVHVLTGGGGGVMAAVSRAFHETPGRKGLVIGVLPSSERPGTPKPGYPNPWVEVPILTHLPSTGVHGGDATSRNHINVLSSDVIIALPGSAGTVSELELAVGYERPIIALVATRDELPGIPNEVTSTSSFDEVRAFVRRALEGLRPRAAEA
jgi:uncharacterized protein (TIGR00725 family)